jgi:hypothetical protein
MASPEGTKLAEIIRQKVDELSKLCASLDEATASQAPADRWTPKQILSHLLGHEGGGLTKALQTYLEQDNPQIDLDPGNHFYTEKRALMTFAQLLTQFKVEYGHMADVAAGLSAEQLARKAHIPALKESPLGEYPTLAIFLGGLAEHHVSFHVDHMREILQALGKA